jgi:hypothetical protein
MPDARQVKSFFAVGLAASAVACSPVPRVDSASAQLFAEAVSICTLLANATPYVGKRVYVSGYLVSTPHGGVFRDESCDRGEMPLARDKFEADNKLARAIRDTVWRANRGAKVPAVMSGILKDHFDGSTPGFRCSSGGICQRYSLESDSLVAARPPTSSRQLPSHSRH